MIDAAAAGSHRFGTVRKHGYDPAEVDAVVERLADALTASQERIRVLEERLEESSASSSAIMRTLAAVEQTKDEILNEATTEADRIREEARVEAEEVMGLTSSLDIELASRRDAILSEAYMNANHVMEEAHAKASQQEIHAAQMASDLIEEATQTANALKVQSEAAARSQDIAAAWALRAVTERANQMVSDAERQAALIVRDAYFESQRLGEKSADIRNALLNLKAAAQALADNTVTEIEVIDLAAVEAASTPFRTVDLIEPPVIEPQLDGSPLAETMPDPRAKEPARETVQDPEIIIDDEPTTYYQRRAGSLRERIEIARSMP